MTPQSISKAFALCAAMYRERFQIPTDKGEARFMIEVWADILADVPDETGIAAFRRHCETDSRPPTPADIRNLTHVNLTLPSAGEAWAEAWDKACSCGYQDGVVAEMSHPEIRAAAKATPWSRICYAKNETELSFTQRDFMRIYEGLVERTEREVSRTAIEGQARPAIMPKMKTIDAAIVDKECTP